MRKSIFLFLILLSAGCERPYDGEKRLVVEGKIIDRVGNPISNQLVKIFVGENTSSFGIFPFGSSVEDYISFGNTDNQGNFKLAFPSPLSINESINVSINERDQFNSFQSLSIKAKVFTFKGFRLNIGTIPLYKLEDLTAFKIVPVQVTPNSSIRNLKITALVPTSNIDLTNITQNQDNFYIETNYTVVKNQTFNITYDLVQNSGTTSQSVSVTIQNQSLEYTLNY